MEQKIVLIISVIVVCVLIGIGAITVRMTKSIAENESGNSKNEYDIGDTSTFSADGSMFNDYSQGVDLVEQAKNEASLVSAYLVGVWLDQYGNIRNFGTDGEYEIQLKEEKRCVTGEYSVEADTEHGSAVICITDSSGESIDYVMNVVNEESDEYEDSLYDEEGEYSVILWSEDEHLVLRR